MTDVPATGSSVAGSSEDSGDTPRAAPDTQAPSLDDHIGAVQVAIARQHADALDAVRSGISAELQSVANATAAAHTEAQRTFDAAWQALREQRETQAIPTDPSNVIRAYRHTVMETVVTPLHDTLHFVDAGAVFRGMRQGIKANRSSLLAGLPETLRRPEPETLYDRDPGDSAWQATRKAAIRAGRWTRNIAGTAAQPTQTVPLRPLTQYHVDHRLPHAEAAVWDDLEQAWAVWVARAERAVIQWSHRVLRAEAAFDLIDALPSSNPDDSADPPLSAEDVPPGNTSASEESSDETESPDASHDEAPSTEPAETASRAAIEKVAALRNAGTRLSAVLRDVPVAAVDEASRRLADCRETAHAVFLDDVHRSDSFMARHALDPDPPAFDDARWVTWHREAVSRLSVGLHLSAIRDAIWTEQESLAGAVVDAGISPARQIMRDSLRRLRALRDEVDALLELPPPGTERRLIQTLDGLLNEILDDLDTELIAALRQTTVRRDMDAVVQTRIDAINDAIEAQPEVFTVHALDEEDPERIDPEAPSQPVQWRKIVRETTTITLFDAWRSILPPVAKTVSEATDTASDVVGIVRFNLGAAIEELQDLMIARRRGESDDAHLEAARELALDGLDRAATLLSNADHPITSAGRPIADAVRATTADAWSRVHERVQAAGQARAQVLRVQTLTESYMRSLTEWGESTGRELSIRLRRALHLGQRRADQIVKMGRTAVGTNGVDERVLQETVAAVITLEDELSEMPLVYRRLFSLRPVRDPDLLAGRSDDLQRIEQFVKQWQNGLPNALVLTGDPGSGLTSLVNVLSATTLRRARRYTIDLPERLRTEAEIAEAFARVLGLGQGDVPTTFDALSQRLLERDPNGRLRVVFIERMEHLFLRTVGGTENLARLLEMLSATDSRFLWIGTMSGFGWQILEAHEPDAAGLVVRHELTPFDRASIEDLIIRRHRRSGLTLTFDPPPESSQPILTRRLARAESEEETQQILREEYFDRLHSLCGQNVMLALFYWFRSVQLTSDGNGVRVAPVPPIRFDFLDAFPLQRSFALKALIEHATLTVDELADVLQISTGTARSLLEALGNAQLIAPAETIGSPRAYAFDGVQSGVRYRVRPMVLHPVARHLRSRNIVH